MLNSLPDTLQNILAIRLDNIGDVVMTSPALRAIKQVYPQARLTLMASPAGAQVVPLLPWVDGVIPWQAVWQDIAKDVPLLPEKEHELVALLERYQFDAAFIFTSFSQSPHPPAYACYLARVPVRVGQSKEFGGGLLSHWVNPLADVTHQVERNLHLLREVGIPAVSERMELHVQPEHRHSAAAILREVGLDEEQPFIVLAPGASAAARRYPEDRFAQAARSLTAESGLPVVLIGSTRERELRRFPELEALASEPGSRVISLIGRTSVPEMAEIIRRAAVLIANNSGAMHIAAAFERPMVILFAGTEHLEQWLPRTAGARILNQPTPCAPCHGFQCPYQLECLDFPAEVVVSEALDLLRSHSPNPSWPTRPWALNGGNR